MKEHCDAKKKKKEKKKKTSNSIVVILSFFKIINKSVVKNKEYIQLCIRMYTLLFT